MKRIKLNDFVIGGGAGVPFFIMGPCVIEDESVTIKTLEALLEITESVKAPFVFKASYDKANRTSIKSFRGPGIKKGLALLKKIRKKYNVPVLTDVHCAHDVPVVADVVDVIQIPAFLCRQTDMLIAAGRSGCAVNIKKGQFMAPADINHSIQKVVNSGNDNIIITERGVSFGYNNLVVDFRSLPIMRALGYPVVFDATHSVQSPSGQGSCSGGDRSMARYLARAAGAVGVDGFFMEVHPDPDKALCDGPNSIALKDLKGILKEIIAVDNAVRGHNE